MEMSAQKGDEMSIIERAQSDPTAWWWYYGQTAAQVSALLTQNNARIVDIQVESVSSAGPIFSVVLVSNTGPYAKEWWWWYGQSADQVGQKLQQLSARLISISPYQDGNNLNFAVVMVSNSGSDGKAWWWFYGSAAQISASLKPLNARVVDLEPYNFNGQTNYAIIAIANSGADGAAWWWWFDISASQIATQLGQTPTQILTLCNDAEGCDVTMQAPPSAEWWYYHGLTAGEVSDNVNQNGARLTLARQSPGPTFDVVMINNSDAYVTRIGNLLRDNGPGWSSFYFKQVGGPVIGSLNAQRGFEPASCIKIVFALYAMQQVQNGTAHLTDWVPLLALDGPSYCAGKQMSLGTGNNSTTTFTGSVILQSNNSAAILPGSIRVTAGSATVTDNGSGALVGPAGSGTINYPTGSISVVFTHAPANGVRVLVDETMQAAITQMMQNSDDARTDMFMHRYGISTLSNFAHSIGMANTNVNGYINCSGAPPNIMTAEDAAHLYEGLANATLLSAANVQILFSMMAGKNYDFSGIWKALQTIIQQEASARSLSSQQVASFENAAQLSQKSGGYGLAGDTSIDGNTVYGTGGNCGWIEIPSCNGQTPSSTQYVFGWLAESTAQGPSTWSAMNCAEIFRETVSAAFATWSVCGQ
jgi:beta-lactamase class A